MWNSLVTDKYTYNETQLTIRNNKYNKKNKNLYNNSLLTCIGLT